MSSARAPILLLLLAHLSQAAPPSTGPEVRELRAFDAYMHKFMDDNKVPGASLAVTRNGRLVYARGFGWSDREARQPVRPQSLFRIASISKPITATAVMQLVENGRLRLEDPMLQHLHDPPPHAEKRLEQISIADLLRHSGGWDRARSFDPMGMSGNARMTKALDIAPPARPRDVMKFMFARRLDFDPGTSMAYSNFGYLVLGRIIEDVTGQAYETYVRERVLAPLGVRSMRIGRAPRELLAPGEVCYYDQGKRAVKATFGPHRGKEVPVTYARPIEIMDAHGGWVASAVDLARFACAFDHPRASPLLKESSIRRMFARPPGILGASPDGKPKAAYYALGWNVRPKTGDTMNTWHTGGIQGTSTLLVRRHDGLNWVVLFNTHSNPKGTTLSRLIDPDLHKVANSIESWPAHDLFAGVALRAKKRPSP